MQPLLTLLVVLAGLAGLYLWYRHERVLEGNGVVHLMSEHEHFHLHVDLPDYMTIQPGDTLHILKMPNLDGGRTDGEEVSYESPVRLHKASWLQRVVTKNSSLAEVVELVDHP